MNDSNPNTLNDLFGDVIYAYTREDAINDGMFREINDIANEAGVKYPVAISNSLYYKYINPEKMPIGQDEKGRLWDMLHVFKCHAKASKENKIYFQVKFGIHLVNLIASCEPKSMTDPSPAITICLPEDD